MQEAREAQAEALERSAAQQLREISQKQADLQALQLRVCQQHNEVGIAFSELKNRCVIHATATVFEH